MPRSGRGGARQGTPGQAYGNRTDLNASLPVQTVTGQGYGVAAAQQAAQRAIPVAAQPVPGANAPVAQGAGPLAQPETPQSPVASLTSQLSPTQMYPGELKFGHPTDAPNEPITAGLPFGDGPGPEAMATNFASPLSQTLGTLARAADASPALMDLARVARNIGL